MSTLSRAAEPPTSATAAEAAPLAWIYASFADGIGGGNPAGVVLTPALLPDEMAQAVAAVLSVPTTGFVVVPGDEPAVADVRFFTPEQEIDACGHVTVAVATALVERGIWRWGNEVTVRAAGGEFALTLRDGLVAMTQRLAFIEPAPVSWLEVRAALGSLEAHPRLPLVCAGTGLRHLIVPVADAAQLAALELDATRIAAFAREADVDTICIFTLTERGRARMRDLCAAIGALEEAASGTTAATLALCLHLDEDDWLRDDEVVVAQGVEMGRPSRLEVSVVARDAAIVRGRARKLLAGTLEPWDDDER